MTSLIKAQTAQKNKFTESQFPSVTTNKLIVKPVTTDLKWNPGKKDRGIQIKGMVDIAKITAPTGYSGVLADKPMLIGTDEYNWNYEALLSTKLLVGMAYITQDVADFQGAPIIEEVTPSECDLVRFVLSTTTLTVTHETSLGYIINQNDYDMASLAGQSLYPWASSTPDNGMSIRIEYDFRFCTTVDPDGKVRMTGSNNDIVDFSIEDIIANDPNAPPLFFDQSLNTFNSVQFVDMLLTGDLTVQGTSTIIESDDLAISDNIIYLNKDETGAGVSLGSSGFEIARGTLANVQFLFDETSDTWTVGETGGTPGTDIFRVAEISDALQTQGAMPGYDANGRLDESEGLSVSEVNQLQNIGAVTITNAQWGYLGGMDQGVSSTSDVTFNNVTIDGSLTLTNPISRNVSAVLVADPAPLSADVTICDTSGGAFTASLPDNATAKGQCFILYLIAAGNDLTIDAAGGDSVEGDPNVKLKIAGQNIQLLSLGNGTWIII
jgi:hypothetical protein